LWAGTAGVSEAGARKVYSVLQLLRQRIAAGRVSHSEFRQIVHFLVNILVALSSGMACVTSPAVVAVTSYFMMMLVGAGLLVLVTVDAGEVHEVG